MPSLVRCSVMSVSHTALGASAVNTRLTRSSCTGGPGRAPLPRRGLPSALHHRLAAQIAHAVRAAIGCPCAAGVIEQEKEVLRRAAAYLSQANLPGK